jgi:dipeptidyl aminopeptidase/acylaminoacyl peptidase
MRILSCFLLLAFLPITAALAAEPETTSPLEPFLKKDVFGTIRISPTGEFLAVTVPFADRTSLAILRRSDQKPTAHVTFEKNSHVYSFDWVSDNRLLFSVATKIGDLEQPRANGDIYRLNADGSGQGAPLIGPGSESKQDRGIYAALVDDLPKEDDFVIVGTTNGNGFSQAERMSVITGRRTVIAKVSVQDASFLTDPSGAVRFATGANSDRKSKTYYRANDAAPWELINDEAVTNVAMSPEGFSADGKTAYLQIEEATGPDGVYAFDTVTKERKLLVRDDNVDPSSYFYSPVDGSIYAVAFMDGLPRVEYLDPANPFAKMHRSLQASFDGQAVVPLSFTKDGNLGLYLVYSDRIPGDFYLFDRTAKKVTYIASRNSWFKPEMLNPMQPISLKARDGMDLQGYLTLPKGSSGKHLPLVVNPHGGPFGPFDQWGYDYEVQMLADHGYAVLQLNYRGSGNYGRAFMHAGYKQWGGKMQDDLTDATHWAVAQGIADANRICIYGASYGGYAALMGVAKEPDLYKCAVGYVGVYDMAAMYHRGDISATKSGKNFLDETLGKDNLDQISPDKLASRIKVPVMLAAGREDQRAPMAHTEKMRDALTALGKPVETTFYVGEGHGNYLMKNKVDFYTKLLAFLDKYIGPTAAAASGK